MKLVKLLITILNNILNHEKKQLDHMRIAAIFWTVRSLSPHDAGHELDDDHEHPPVWADRDPLSHRMKLVK